MNINFKSSFLRGAITLSIFLTSVTPVFAFSRATEMKVVLNNKPIKFSVDKGYPMLDNQRTYLPLRILSESMGINLQYDQKTSAVQIRMNNKAIDLFNNNHVAVINGERVPIDVRNGKEVKETTVKIVNGITYVPIRFVSEQLGVDIVYDKGDLLLFTDTIYSMEKDKVYSGSLIGTYENSPHLGEASTKMLKELIPASKNLSKVQVMKLDIESLPTKILGKVNILDLKISRDFISITLDKKIPRLVLLLLRDDNIRCISNLYPSFSESKDGKYVYVFNSGGLYDRHPYNEPGQPEGINNFAIMIPEDSAQSIGRTTDMVFYLSEMK